MRVCKWITQLWIAKTATVELQGEMDPAAGAAVPVHAGKILWLGGVELFQ